MGDVIDTGTGQEPEAPPPSPFEQAFIDQEPTSEVDEPEVDEPEGGEEIPPEPEQEPAESQLTPEQIEAFIQLDTLMKQNPQFVEHINKFFEPAAPTTDKPVEPTDDVPAAIKEHLENPIVATLWEQNKSQIARLEELSKRYETLEQDVQARRSAELNAASQSAVDTFKDEYELTPEQVHQVRDAAVKLNVLPALLSGVDPITGKAVPPDITSAFKRSMEIAYWQIPEFRERELTRSATEQTQNKQRKAKAGSVSGSSGSGKREVAVSKDPKERQEQMIAAVANAMGVN